MIPQSFDSSSIILFLLGKDNPWIPIIMLIAFIIQKKDNIINMYYKVLEYGKVKYTLKEQFHVNVDEDYIYGDIANSVWALIYYMNNTLKDNKNILSSSIYLHLPHSPIFEKNDNIVIPNSKMAIELTPNISCRVDIGSKSREIVNKEKSHAIDTTEITFTLLTNKNINTIMEFMDNIVKDFTKVVDIKRKNKKAIVKPSFGIKHDNLTRLGEINYIEFKSTKTFDTLFFDGKDELIHRLNTFVNRDKYAMLGLPQTLGILLYGDPGTGKTSCIKAIANYLDMSLIIVPMNQIKTRRNFEDIFASDRIGIPQDKRIYVFEEIDCNGWQDIVCDRKILKDKILAENIHDKDAKKEQVILEKIADTLKPTKKKVDEEIEDKLTLGSILEVIDGLIEYPGRIIIMTTNHKEHLDPALLRPGRIDIGVEFKKLRGQHIADIYRKWYGKELDSYIIDDITDYKYSQAEISQLLFKYEDNPKEFVKEITV